MFFDFIRTSFLFLFDNRFATRLFRSILHRRLGDRMPKKRRSYKHPILEDIFKRKRNEKIPPDKQKIISFTLQELRREMERQNVPATRASISNFVLDLVRKDRGIESRLPPYIYERGYDLRKKTGPAEKGESWAGEFIYVGVGNVLMSWLRWPDEMPQIEVDSSSIPKIVLEYIRRDEGALFSVIDYCDLMKTVLKHVDEADDEILRVQHPIKWQPNEIDGFYISSKDRTLLPVEAKALTTGDQINLDQFRGGVLTLRDNYPKGQIQAIACKMVKNGIYFAIFPKIDPREEIPEILEPISYLHVTFNPKIKNWLNQKQSMIDENQQGLSVFLKD